jgi:hypothetical protein
MPWNDMELKASRKDVAGPKIPKTRKKTYFFFLEFRGMPRHPGKNSIATDRQGKWVKIYFSENKKMLQVRKIPKTRKKT